MICAAIGIIFISIYRESYSDLARALKAFQAALPPGAEITWRRANPNFLVRGATLHDVTFRYKTIHFHARSVRFGSPQARQGGNLSLSSLLIKEPGYANSDMHINMSQLLFRHLMIPSDDDRLVNSDITAASMHSLARILQFEPDHLATLRFESAHAEAVHLLVLPAAKAYHGLMQNSLGLRSIDADQITLEGYSLGGNVGLSLQDLRIAFTLNPTILAMISPISLPDSFFPATKPDKSLPYRLTLKNLSAHEGVVHLLDHPFKTNPKTSVKFWKDPIGMMWGGTGSIALNQLVFERLEPAYPEDEHPKQACLDSFIATRRDEGASPGTGLDTEAMLQGFHLRLASKALLYPIPGAGITLRLSEHSHKKDSLWESDITGQFSLPDIGNLGITSHATFPDDPRENLLSRIILQSTTFSFQGDNLVTLVMTLFPTPKILPEQQKPLAAPAKDNSKDTKSSSVPATASTPAPQTPNTTQSAQDIALVTKRDAVVHELNTLALTRPLLAPLSDYILDPQNRTLNVTFGHFSLETLGKIPLSGPANALFDSLHITAITAR